MTAWTIAAAQYEPRNRSVAENIAHHLRFIDAAARAACEILVFPELSLTGPALCPPPNADELQPLAAAATRHQMTIITGLPLQQNDELIKGLAIFVPDNPQPLTCPQGKGTCLAPLPGQVSVLAHDAAADDLDPRALLLATSDCPDESHQQLSRASLQRFAHKYAIAVLKSDYANGSLLGGSALWDEQGQLVVRADGGELLLTGQRSDRGWQGDIIPLR
ncbi:carbon-nitrogen hydrolase family protein [Yokenella regensburgei]|uniref:carbon-nitrogen hydrolase family protein n=1 Tax=Yokenella regensburgei TaxID=158877 RepID=UPI0013754E36|nr:carbon-nitrogen hydrolase family protein [Yokenella regensburgei]KAF1368452.1 putative amidohydrolase [Yokenella regensburgei]